MRRQLFVNGALLALALGTLGVVWATREEQTTTELQSRKDKLLPSFRKDAVSRLVLSQAGRELQLETTAPGEFRIVKPWPERADIATVNQLLGALDLASVLRTAEGVSAEQAGLGAAALHIRVEMGATMQTLVLGGAAPSPTGARYAELQADGGQKRFVVSQGVAEELSLPFDKFREPRLLEYGRSELGKLELVQTGGTLLLSRAEHGAFFVQLGAARELASSDVVERLLTALSRLSTEHFIEAAQAKQALTNPALRVTLTLTDQSLPPIVLTFGTCPGTPAEALVLKEQAGRPARAGCVPEEISNALRATTNEARLEGVFAARADEIEELLITRGSQKLDLARRDKGFVLRAPSRAEVPLDAGNARISAILSARGERPASASLVELGLEPAAGALSIQVTGADVATHRSEQLLVGAARRDGSVCVRRLADAVVLCFAADTARAFEPDATLLKGLTPFSFAPSALASFSIETPNLHQSVRRSEDGGYSLEEPKGFKHDGSLVADAVQTLGTLQALRWVTPADDASLGLKPPRVHVSIALAAGKGEYWLDIGAATTGGFFARASTDPGVFVLPRSVVETLAQPLIERSLVAVPEVELARIQLESAGRSLTATRTGDRWQGSLNGETVEAILALKAERTVHVGAARPLEGFAKPSAVVRFGTKNGQQYRLAVGANDTLDDSPIAYARLDGVDATFALSGRTAAVLRDATDTNPRE